MGMKLETSCSLAEILGNPVQDQWDSDREDMVAFKFLHHHVSSCIIMYHLASIYETKNMAMCTELRIVSQVCQKLLATWLHSTYGLPGTWSSLQVAHILQS